MVSMLATRPIDGISRTAARPNSARIGMMLSNPRPSHWTRRTVNAMRPAAIVSMKSRGTWCAMATK